MVDPVTGNELAELEMTTVFPAKHYVTPFEQLAPAIKQIECDLEQRLEFFDRSGKLLRSSGLKSAPCTTSR